MVRSPRRIVRKLAPILFAAAMALPGAALTASPATAAGPHYYVLIGGTCDGPATVYDGLDLRGGIALKVHYPAGSFGLPNCDWTPMDQSVEIGRRNAAKVIKDHWNPDATYTIVGYSQGAWVANLVLEDIADGKLPVNKSRFNARLYADPMAPVGPPGRGIGTLFPKGAGLPSPFSGYVSPGTGRTNFDGIPYTRYCIDTDGICHADSIESPGGYFAQHWCYRGVFNGRSIMQDTIVDGPFRNASQRYNKVDCWAGPIKPPGFFAGLGF